MRSEAIETAASGGARLRVEFTWETDRYSHVIWLVNATQEREPLLKSIEGASDDHWPPSSPLQSLSIEKLPDGRTAALLVGMAGRSHWSASVEPAADGLGLTMDVACRHSQEPKWLGNRYRRLSAAADNLSIHADAAELITEGEHISIRPRTIASGAATTRWKFTVSMRPVAAHPAPAKAKERQR